jgi:predicted amidophosphoribosyltransferase
MQTCENCAQPLREGARFCPACGSTAAPLDVLTPAVDPIEDPPPLQSVVSDLRHTAGRVSNPVISCPACGATHDEWAPFCGTCGAPAPPAAVLDTVVTTASADVTTASAEQAPACRKCGRAMRPAQHFCISCGTQNQFAVDRTTYQTTPAATADVSSTVIIDPGSIKLPPKPGAPTATWQQAQPPWASSSNERPVPHVPPSPEMDPNIEGGSPVPPDASGEAATGRPDRSRGSLLTASVLTAVLIVAGAGVGIHLLTSPSPASKEVAPTKTPSSPHVTVATSTLATTTTPVRPAPTTAPTDPQAAALAKLQALRAFDLPKIALAGQWIAQLASKTPGIVDLNQTTARGDHNFTAADILDEYQKARSNPIYGTYVGLLLSTDYGTRQLYKGRPLWVTLAAVPGFSSADAVRTWCAQQFPTLTGSILDDFCTPRTLDPLG